jgi:hypothetical protein
MKNCRRSAWIAVIVCLAMLAAPATAHIGSLTCSWGYEYRGIWVVTLAANIMAFGASPTLQSFVGVCFYSCVRKRNPDHVLRRRSFQHPDGDALLIGSRLFDDLIQGKLGAAVADNPRGEIVAKLFPSNVACVGETRLATYPAAFAVRRGNLEFINFLNSWIGAHTADKWLEERRNYWFKNTDWLKDL